MSGKDSAGSKFLSGWGKDRRIERRLERRERERQARRLEEAAGSAQVEEEFSDRVRGFASGGIIPPSLKYDDKQGPYLLAPGYVIPQSVADRFDKETLKRINKGTTDAG